MSSYSLVVHRHGLSLQLHVSSHSGAVESCGLFLLTLALTSVKNVVIILPCIVCN